MFEWCNFVMFNCFKRFKCFKRFECFNRFKNLFKALKWFKGLKCFKRFNVLKGSYWILILWILRFIEIIPLNGVLKHLILTIVFILAWLWKLVSPCQWAHQEGAMLCFATFSYSSPSQWTMLVQWLVSSSYHILCWDSMQIVN